MQCIVSSDEKSEELTTSHRNRIQQQKQELPTKNPIPHFLTVNVPETTQVDEFSDKE